MNSMRGNDDQKLDALLGAYRAACKGPEPSANFMPELWARIESRQSFTFSFRRMANAFTTAAVALSVVRVVDDVPLPEVEGNLPAVPADAVRLKNLGERWGLGSSLSRFLTAVASQS